MLSRPSTFPTVMSWTISGNCYHRQETRSGHCTVSETSSTCWRSLRDISKWNRFSYYCFRENFILSSREYILSDMGLGIFHVDFVSKGYTFICQITAILFDQKRSNSSQFKTKTKNVSVRNYCKTNFILFLD